MTPVLITDLVTVGIDASDFREGQEVLKRTIHNAQEEAGAALAIVDLKHTVAVVPASRTQAEYVEHYFIAILSRRLP